MEIAPVPHRPDRGEQRRLARALLVLLPVVLLVLVPDVMGLHRLVVTDRALHGSAGRGSVVLTREVPPEDLRAGDVVVLPPSAGASDERLVRRVAAIEDGVATVEADGAVAGGPRQVALTEPAYARVWIGVPWIGYPFVSGGGWAVLAAAALAALLLALLVGRRAPDRPVSADRTRQPVA